MTTASQQSPTSVAKLELEQQAFRLVGAARVRLILAKDSKSCFFATLALRLPTEVDWSIPTMATDGRKLAINPEFVAALEPDELIGCLAHEVMHCALGHPWRCGPRKPNRWNIAADLAINYLLIEAGFRLPAGRLMPGERPFDHFPMGRSADEYYGMLADDVELSESLGSGNDPGGCGSVLEAPASEAKSQETAAAWSVAMAQAATAARGRGELPAGLDRFVTAVLYPPADWRAILRQFLNTNARNDYSWLTPNRRFIHQGLYLPGLRSAELGHIVVAVDTSGSIGARMLGRFADELNGMLDAYDCTVTVLYHDTAIQKSETWRSGDGGVTLNPVGGGGTSHVCVFEFVEAADEPINCVICLTDLETRFPVHAPSMPVLWAVIGDGNNAPFGQVVRLTD